jgi:hypothetical protein
VIEHTDTVTDEFDRPVPGASIYVKNIDGTDATLTSDGTTALVQPIITDEFGTYTYWANVGYYTEEVWYGGKLRWKEANIALGNPGSDLNLRSDLAATGGYALVNHKPTGATGDGVTGDTAAITAFNALPGRKYLPAGTYLTTLAATSLDGPFWGDGQIKDADGNKRGPWLTIVKAAPSSTGNFNDVATAFNGDLSKVLIPIEHRILGTNTLGTPLSGYLYSRETSAVVLVSRNESGHNESTSTNDGRTAAVAIAGKIGNYGQGDHVFASIAGYVQGARAGATDFLANPAISMINGTFTAGAHGVFLNPFEVDLELFAYDAGAIGHVTNITRNTGDTGAGLGALTAGYRVQSKGTYAVDVGFSATGLFKAILDATAATLTTAKAAIALCSGFRIYGNASSTDGRKATSYGTDWIERLATGWNIVFNNVSGLLVSDSGFGYATGVGGAVTQATSRTTGVTLNTVCGKITLVSAAGSATWQTFTVTNSKVAANDTIRVCQQSGTDKYQIHVTKTQAGSFDITFATIGGTTTEQPVFNFAVIKGAAS